MDRQIREAHIALQQTAEAVAETSEPFDMESSMLALIASRVPSPAEESAVGDPGFLTLAISLVRAARQELAAALHRHCNLMARAGGPIPL